MQHRSEKKHHPSSSSLRVKVVAKRCVSTYRNKPSNHLPRRSSSSSPVTISRMRQSTAIHDQKMSLSHHKLFQPLQIGDKTLSHRITMTACTRNRTDELLRPTHIHAEYYGQRASEGGLLVTEATVVAPQSIGSRHQPGIWTSEQAEAWKQVTAAVHEKKGLIASQLWHQGRNSSATYSEHPLAKAVGAIVCEAPSEIAGEYPTITYETQFGQPSVPRAVTKDDIKRIQQQFLTAAKNALDVSGFDFVEIHGASGYLIDQFLNDSSNQRTDEYGGSIENRLRFMVELVELLVAAFPKKVGIRISPNTPQASYFGTKDSNPDVLFTAVFAALAQIKGLAYVAIAEPVAGFFTPNELPVQHSHLLLGNFREVNPDTKLITSAGFSPQAALDTFAKPNPAHDAVGFGRWFIANPDLAFRIRHNLPLNQYDRNTFYTMPGPLPDGGFGFNQATFATGYTDYPSFEQIVHTKLGSDVNVNDVIGNTESLAKLIAATKDDPHPLISIEEIGYAASSSQRQQKSPVSE